MRSGIVIKKPFLGLISLRENPQKSADQPSQTDKIPKRSLLLAPIPLSQAWKTLRAPFLPPKKYRLSYDYWQKARKKT
jgi:hypothetical protein